MIAFGRWLQINFFFNTRVHSWKVINKLLQDCSTYIVNCMLQSSVWDKKKKKTSRCFPWDRRLVICNEQTAVETDFSQSTGGAVVIALTSHECDLGANTRPQVVMVSSVLLVLASALFFFCSGFHPFGKPTLQILIRSMCTTEHFIGRSWELCRVSQ